jgi:hypothetical protein
MCRCPDGGQRLIENALDKLILSSHAAWGWLRNEDIR